MPALASFADRFSSGYLPLILYLGALKERLEIMLVI